MNPAVLSETYITICTIITCTAAVARQDRGGDAERGHDRNSMKAFKTAHDLYRSTEFRTLRRNLMQERSDALMDKIEGMLTKQ